MNYWYDNTLSLRQKAHIEKRIADPDAGYPEFEALYWNEEEYDTVYGSGAFERYMEILISASAGIGGDGD